MADRHFGPPPRVTELEADPVIASRVLHCRVDASCIQLWARQSPPALHVQGNLLCSSYSFLLHSPDHMSFDLEMKAV